MELEMTEVIGPKWQSAGNSELTDKNLQGRGRILSLYFCGICFQVLSSTLTSSMHCRDHITVTLPALVVIINLQISFKNS